MELDDYWTVGNETVASPNSLQGVDLSNWYENRNRAAVRVNPKKNAAKGSYRDALILTVGGEEVYRILLNITMDIHHR